jgi:two-component system OmpR family sensor kinase
MTWRLVVVAVWAVSVGVLALWWLLTRRRPDVWRAMPVPAALLDADGRVVDHAGPAPEPRLPAGAGLPARGLVVRTAAADGTPVAVSGLRRGAVAVALPGDPVEDRKDRLLADLAPRLAHEVTTPLTAVTGHLDLLAHEPLSDTAQRSIDICRAEVARITDLARDLLTLTTVRAGSASRATHNAAVLAEEAVAGMLPRADDAGPRLSVQVPAERVLVRVADGELIRALRNLVRNALQHGGDGAVLVAVAADADTVTFSVSDAGPGIPPGQLARMCEPMVRGPAATTGHGLGLAIVAEVLAAHGSRLESSRQPAGSTLSFRLPRVALA